jgi:FlaA1/EpsC-like NDP-sugar epimerase
MESFTEQESGSGLILQFLIDCMPKAVDVLLLVSAFILAYLLRFDFSIPERELVRCIVQTPAVVAIQCVCLYLCGVHAFIWHYVGMAEVKTFVKTAVAPAGIMLLARFALPDSLATWHIPVSVIILDTLLVFGSTMGARVLRRAAYERFQRRRSPFGPSAEKIRSVLLIGAGKAGRRMVSEIRSRDDSGLDIKGFVDDDIRKQHMVIEGVEVLGTTKDLPLLVQQLGIDEVVISVIFTSRKQFRRILDICERLPVKIRIIPSLFEILQGRVKVSRIRDLEVADLLGREPVQLEEAAIREAMRGKVVAVTGAGGSIGSELARQVASFHPKQLLLIERAEFAIFHIHSELRQRHAELALVPLTVDIGNEVRMTQIFARYRPEVLVHSAAHKHVPLMEENVAEAVSNNVLNTYRLGEIAGNFNAEVFVLISTDKAVRPTSIMGASKRAAELVVQSLNSRYRTRYVAVRFGNVIGSTGSVIPIFYEQIRRGGPVTVTHPEMKRYFMTIPEAAQLVLEASTIGKGGEIFVLDMGEPVKILELAKDVITLSGLRPYEDIDIVFTGIRPGEKLFEELEISEECMSRTRHPKIFIGKIAGCPKEKIHRALQRLAVHCQEDNAAAIVQVMSDLVPDAQLARGAAVLDSSAPVGSTAAAAASD